MTISSPSELIRALLAEAFEDVVGTQESEWLDFKESPPSLGDARGKWELAKDVAAFANAGLGYIVIGVKTEKHVNEAVETASEVLLLSKETVDVDAYRKVIRSLIYPPLVGLGIEFYPGRKDADEALLVIEITPQESRNIPFMLRKALDEGGTVRGAVAIPVRDGDQTDWWSAERVHELVSHGLQPLPPSRMAMPAPNEELVDRAGELVDRAEELQEWDDSPTFALIAMPTSPADLVPRFYGNEGLTKLLADPPSLREMGFNLGTGAKLEAIEGAAMVRAQHKLLILDPSGIFAAVVPGDRSFLQWGINDGVLPETHRMNTLTLAEFTYEFFRFAAELKSRSGVPEWSFRLVARRFKSGGVMLEKGLAQPGAGHHWGQSAAGDSWIKDWIDLGTAERNATRALTYFYALFQRGPDDFAVFTSDGNVSAEAILAAAQSLR